MKKEFIKYGFYTLALILVLTFVYPTLYRYDKYDQKIPVRINRITGKTEMLYSTGWIVPALALELDLSKYLTVTPSPIPTPNTYKGETFQQYYDRVIGEMDPKQTAPNKNHLFIEWEKARTGIIDNLVDPKDYFTIGSTKDQVRKAMGTPTAIGGSVWNYGFSRVYFDNNDKVESYDDNSGNLKVK
ncbi:MAG: hypothetical protein JWM44_4223 [Bacilli bacterium]|nr:hypothetical protein [Bacilli bacterium]